MNLRKLILTENACYKAGRTITPKGIMVHSTGANNPNLKRYVGPDDGLLGKNQYGNHWNTYTPGGREVCVHAFIGRLANGTIATYQTLPWNHRGWHGGGSSNNTHISFEICEDGLNDGVYFAAVYKEAAELCAYLCKQYGLPASAVICHSEGYKRGIASNHGDVMHWFPRFGKSMDTFRAEVGRLLSGGTTTPAPPTSSTAVKAGSLVKIATGATYYNGKAIPDWVLAQHWFVRDVKGDRAVIDKNQSGTNSISSPMNVKFLSVVGSGTPAPATPTFQPYLVKVTADDLNIRKGAGTNFGTIGAITDKGVYTIVAEASGSGAIHWGKLKSGAGWISLDYVRKV